MDPVVASMSTFIAIVFGAMAGIWLSRHLPERHLSSESRTAVSVSMAVVGTLSALVMSLLISSSSASFSARADAVNILGVDIIRLDRALHQYGPSANHIRELLQQYAQTKTQQLDDNGSKAGLDLTSLAIFENISIQVFELQPGTHREREVRQQAIKVLDEISNARWLLVEKSAGSLPAPFLTVLIFWLAILFGSFGLFAPPNATVLTVILLCGLAISGGVFVILDLGTLTEGIIRVSVAPMQNAIKEITAAR
jgi:hypothetical protein